MTAGVLLVVVLVVMVGVELGANQLDREADEEWEAWDQQKRQEEASQRRGDR